MDVSEPLPSTSTALNNINLPNAFDRTTLSEVILSVHNFLEHLNCGETTRVLRDEINRQQILAPRHDLLEDRMEAETFEHFAQTHENTADLIPLIEKLNDISQKRFTNGNQPSIVRLSAHPPYSLTCADAKPGPPQIPPVPVIPTLNPLRLNSFRTKDRLQTIQFGGNVPSQMILSKKILTDYKRHTRMMGHKSPIYCITFDRTGKYIITGADDNLIKVWDAQSCILRYTFRGHSAEICDLAVAHENTLLASGSNDKTVRVWCMQKGTPTNVFKQHTGQISTVCFPAFFQGGIRYLVSGLF
uniref:Uncharacterized protein n=1 Tax=Panagrolaimus superbus TaxID=310955 RepID=A0A914YF65_9BILA